MNLIRIITESNIMIMKKIETIRCYRSNIEIIPTEGEMIDFCFDGMGEYTRQEFVEYNDWMQEFSKRDQQRIMDEIEGQFNVDFFLSEMHRSSSAIM